MKIKKRILNEQESLGISSPSDVTKLKKFLRTMRDNDNSYIIKFNTGELTTDLFFEGGGRKSGTNFKETVTHKQLLDILPFVLGLTDSYK